MKEVTDHGSAQLPPELEELANRLHEERPRLSAVDLDRVGIRLRGATKSPVPKKGTVMKSRLAIVLMLTTGIILGGTGVSLGVTALQNTDSAATSEYGVPDCSSDGSCNDVLGENSSGGKGSGGVVQSGLQRSAAAAGTLPFTGYLAIPVLILGIVLVGAGLVLRRTAMREEGTS